MDSALHISVMFALFAMVLVAINKENQKKWKRAPTLDEYLDVHRDALTSGGIKCAHCESTARRDVGISGAKSTLRHHVCEGCSTLLYRTKRKAAL